VAGGHFELLFKFRRKERPTMCNRYFLRTILTVVVASACLFLGFACIDKPESVQTDPAVKAQRAPRQEFDDKIEKHANKMLEEGKEIFRYDTFGSEAFWGDQLQLHKAILRDKKGGVGEGLSAIKALQLGLKVDRGKIPRLLVEVLKEGSVDLAEPDTTLELLRADAVVGVKGVFDKSGNMTSVGITCAICHSTVDDSFMKGIGRRLDGWPNRDLNIGAIVAMAPNLKPMADLLQLSESEVREVLNGWGPGRYDAELNQDRKGTRPDGKTGATLIPAAFGMAGQNLHTYAGWGSVPYWNAYVANTQMYGKGTFVDRRMNEQQYPVVARSKFNNKRDNPDLVTSKLAALHFYQLAIPAPTPPENYYNKDAAKRGEAVFNTSAKCATCHVPPLFSEPGYPMHTAAEIGIDDFQSSRSPDRMYRTTPLRGLFARSKGGFYHDGRFATLYDVIEHYNRHLNLNLEQQQKNDLAEYLKSL
jgi:mono/diheme cytochrome c family protein